MYRQIEEGRGEMKMDLKGKPSRMGMLFLYAAMAQGAIAAFITFLGAFGDQLGLYPVSVSRVIASGEAGTWFIMGYVMYMIVGVVAMAVTSLFYFYIENIQGKVYKGAAKALSWVHLILGNVGVAGTAILAMVGGYLGGAAMQPTQYGGMAYTTGQVHVHILQFYEQPVAAFLALALIGFAAGGLGYILALREK
jgi:heme/copper-type cytochrome/quinol oxidase subunit 1